jgi:hypothetical protein
MKNIVELLIAIVCVFGILKQLFRIIWLYFPSFMKGSFLHKGKEPGKTEMLLYYLLAITAMAYYLVVTVERIL